MLDFRYREWEQLKANPYGKYKDYDAFLKKHHYEEYCNLSIERELAAESETARKAQQDYRAEFDEWVVDQILELREKHQFRYLPIPPGTTKEAFREYCGWETVEEDKGRKNKQRACWNNLKKGTKAFLCGIYLTFNFAILGIGIYYGFWIVSALLMSVFGIAIIFIFLVFMI